MSSPATKTFTFHCPMDKTTFAAAAGNPALAAGGREYHRFPIVTTKPASVSRRQASATAAAELLMPVKLIPKPPAVLQADVAAAELMLTFWSRSSPWTHQLDPIASRVFAAGNGPLVYRSEPDASRGPVPGASAHLRQSEGDNIPSTLERIAENPNLDEASDRSSESSQSDDNEIDTSYTHSDARELEAPKSAMQLPNSNVPWTQPPTRPASHLVQTPLETDATFSSYSEAGEHDSHAAVSSNDVPTYDDSSFRGLTADAMFVKLREVALKVIRRTKPDARFVCPWDGCTKTSNERKNFIRHVQSHSNYRPFNCFCGHSSRFKNDLYDHIGLCIPKRGMLHWDAPHTSFLLNCMNAVNVPSDLTGAGLHATTVEQWDAWFISESNKSRLRMWQSQQTRFEQAPKKRASSSKSGSKLKARLAPLASTGSESAPSVAVTIAQQQEVAHPDVNTLAMPQPVLPLASLSSPLAGSSRKRAAEEDLAATFNKVPRVQQTASQSYQRSLSEERTEQWIVQSEEATASAAAPAVLSVSQNDLAVATTGPTITNSFKPEPSLVYNNAELLPRPTESPLPLGPTPLSHGHEQPLSSSAAAPSESCTTDERAAEKMCSPLPQPHKLELSLASHDMHFSHDFKPLLAHALPQISETPISETLCFDRDSIVWGGRFDDTFQLRTGVVYTPKARGRMAYQFRSTKANERRSHSRPTSRSDSRPTSRSDSRSDSRASDFLTHDKDAFLRHVIDYISSLLQLADARFPPSTVRSARYWDTPAKNELFQGRKSELGQLSSLAPFGPDDSIRVCAILGRKGIGKTQLAVAYAYQNSAAWEFVGWVRGDSPDSILSSYHKLAEALALDVFADTQLQDLASMVNAKLERSGPFLLIVDNASHSIPLPPFPKKGGVVLITTREAEWSATTAAVPLDVLPMDDALELVLAQCSRTKELTDYVTEQLQHPHQRSPLTLIQLGAYLATLPPSLAPRDSADSNALEQPCSFAHTPHKIEPL
ncbi:hypothetical protein CAOG_07922 [Capsaspora owczarzaki ATCC 30864]|nr:hypothetical protein CAOG_07922 [Capsaspora owczarzaki ATCC 30864]KJE97831.1 hypothetical protein, variant 1 [Capsaspora owczarzaki ATCC 30864]|eukprot:XP_004343007.1 hypothetical protein CAOG_07922 [Capsaspora owczarzaki ATCC 30864]